MAWTETAHVEVLLEQRPYDVQTYHEYMQWYVSRSRTRLTRTPQERPEHVTHQESLGHSYDRYNASRRDDIVRHLQSLVISLMIFVIFVTEPVLSLTSVGAGAAHRRPPSAARTLCKGF